MILLGDLPTGGLSTAAFATRGPSPRPSPGGRGSSCGSSSGVATDSPSPQPSPAGRGRRAAVERVQTTDSRPARAQSPRDFLRRLRHASAADKGVPRTLGQRARCRRGTSDRPAGPRCRLDTGPGLAAGKGRRLVAGRRHRLGRPFPPFSDRPRGIRLPSLLEWPHCRHAGRRRPGTSAHRGRAGTAAGWNRNPLPPRRLGLP